MSFASTGELISAASQLAGSWGDAQADVEHAAVAVLQKLVTGAPIANTSEWVGVAARIAAAREGTPGADRFASVSARRPSISAELRLLLEPLTVGLPRQPDEWLEWIEGGLRRSARRKLNDLSGEVATLVPGLRRATGARRATPVPHTLDLTELAAAGHLNPVFGREAELKTVIRVLTRMVKNHPVLIGPPGVGKTAIVELLAARVVEGAVPELLRGVRILQLSMGELLAGTRYRGDLEERLGHLIRNLADDPGHVILFVDEVHLLVGAGLAEGSPVDLGNLLKPALARGAIQLIGATTELEYGSQVRRDPALERRLHPILIAEPGLGDTALVLDRLGPTLELHHGVSIPASVIRRAALMSSALMADRFQPDKAIDLLDEACANHGLASTADRSVTIDDLLAVSSDWRRQAPSEVPPSEVPLAPRTRKLLVTAIVAALAQASLEPETAPRVIEAMGVGDPSAVVEELRCQLGDIATIDTTPGARPGGPDEDRPAAASVVLLGGRKGDVRRRLAGVLDDLGVSTIPWVIVLMGNTPREGH